MIILAVIAGVALAQAAGGIKGQARQAEESQQRAQGLKRPSQQQQYQPPPPPPAPQAARPQPQAIKGPGKVAPVFSAARVQPVAQQQQQQVLIQQQEQEQQQETEIDPNAAAQDSAPAILAPAAAAAPASEEEANPRPEPYAFNYAFESGDSATSGSSQREESQDASGKVTGKSFGSDHLCVYIT